MTSLKIVKGRELAQGVVGEVVLPERFGRFSIGRDPSNQWAIPDRSLAISSRHCEIVATAAGPALRDVSTNGTFVNGSTARLAGDHVLRDGDRFELGPYVVVVHVPVGYVGAVDPAVPSNGARDPAQPRPAQERAVRGGDPAAMLAAGGKRASSGLTEILRNLPPVETETTSPDQIVTKIRAAPKPVPKATAAPDPAAAARAAAALPSFAAPSAPAASPSPFAAGRGESLRPLATALGLSADAFDGRDPAEVLAQIGQLARASVGLLRQLLDAAADQQVRIGGRMPPRSNAGEVDPLRLAATPEAALRALLAPGADVQGALQRAAATLRG